jgi:hypothetical protein
MNNQDQSIDVYERLAQVLDATPQGFPRMKSGVEVKLLRMVFSPEEVSLAGHMTIIRVSRPKEPDVPASTRMMQ